MLIYTNSDKVNCYIHIPKNSGKHIRNLVETNKENIIIKKFWGISANQDVAHIPFMLKNRYIDSLKLDNISYYTYVRNPYNRIISAFFYLNRKGKIDDFKKFIRTKLITYNFNTSFDKNIIHYYPQYMFICDTAFQINEVKFEKLENQKHLSIREYNLSDFFEDDMIKIVNSIYKLDFELFDYVLITKL